MNTNTPSKSDLYQAMPANNAFTINTISQLVPLADGDEQNADGTKKSIDERVFSDFTIDGSAKDFKQIKLEEVKLAAYEQKQKEKDDDFEGMLREQAVADMKKMFSLHGYEFSAEAMQEVAGDALSDFERISRERGWDTEEAGTVHGALFILKDPNSTDTEIDQALKDINKVDPDYAKDFAKDAETKTIKNESEISLTQSETQLEADELDGMLSDSENDSFTSLTKTPSSGTTECFNCEAAGNSSSTNNIENNLTQVEQLPPAPF